MLLAVGVALRSHRRHYGRQSLWQPSKRRPRHIEEKHYHLHRVRCTHGPLGAVCCSCDDNGNTLGPYSIAVFLTLGALLSCFIWNIYFMKKPLVGEPVNFSGFFKARSQDTFSDCWAA